MKDLVLGERYRILDRIGEGGMAFVYLALDEKLDRQVAIKVLHDHMARSEELRERFHAEARAASSLDHPNIVKVYDFSGSTSETLWIVTEILRGVNLAQFAKRFPARQLHPALAGLLTRETCRALEAAHLHGIVHRDVKPENIMLTDAGVVKLMDFGISKNLQHHSMTMTGTFMGSPSYMSPEQTRGNDVDHRSDIYSVGVLFYELLTGRLPFTGQTTQDVILKIGHGVFTPPRAFVALLEPRLEAMVLKCMAIQPQARYQHITELGQDIDHLLSEHGFVESHVELQRYYADRMLFETRLARVHGLGGLTGPQASTSPTRVTPMIETTPRLPEKTPAPSLSIPNQSRTMAPEPVPQAMTATPAALMKPQVPTILRTQEHIPTLNYDQAEAVSQQVPVPPPAMQNAPAAQRAPVVQRHAPATQQEAPVQHPLIARQLPSARPAPGRVPRQQQPHIQIVYQESPVTRFLGIMLIGLILATAVWAIIAIDQKVKTAKHPKLPPRVESALRAEPQEPAAANIEAPVSNNRLAVRPIAPPVHELTKKQQPGTKQTVVLPPSSKSTHKSPRKTARVIDHPVLPGNPVKAPPASRPSRTAAVVTPKELPVAPSPPTDKSPVNEAMTGMGAIALSSHPAAEIFIDGLRMGTTIDRTTSSAWIPLKSGQHAIELRRTGYDTYHKTIGVKGGERATLDPIELDPAIQETSFSLTLRVNDSATATIRGVDSSYKSDLQIVGGARQVQLPAGRYRVHVERNGVVREKVIILNENMPAMTFSVDFPKTVTSPSNATEAP